MQTNTTIEPPGSAAPGIVPEPVRVRRDAEATPATARHQPNPAGMVLAKLLSVIRGDKYMADAYPPAWRSAGPTQTRPPAGHHDDDGVTDLGRAPGVELAPHRRGHAPVAPQSKER